MEQWKLAAAEVLATATAQPASARDIMAMCSTSDFGDRFVTNIAPVAIPDDVTGSRDLKDKLVYIVSATMRALGMDGYQTAGCTFEEPSFKASEGMWMNGNQPQSSMIDFQRRLIEKGYKLYQVARLDTGESTPKGGLGGATPPPDIHDDGEPLSFFYWVGMVPTPNDTRNPNCVSNVVTLKDKVDWKEWGSAGRAAKLAAPFKATFDARCRQLGALEPGPGGSPIFDEKNGRFIRTPGSNDRIVTLP